MKSSNPDHLSQLFPFLNEKNEKTALLTDAGSSTYAGLSKSIRHFAGGLLNDAGDLQEERIAFLLPAGFDYVYVLFGVWAAGGIAVPLNISSPPAELKYALSCAGVSRLITTKDRQDSLAELCAQLKIKLNTVTEISSPRTGFLPEISPERRAMILFTSGTISKPKGVVSTHKNIRSQIESLIRAWQWDKLDTIPLFLPLHHIHGIINILCSALWAGAAVQLFPAFDIKNILTRVAEKQFTLFMAVPTIYVKIISYLEKLGTDESSRICQGFASMRLNVSGSAACPRTLFKQWQELTGQILLERYGMTEIGMALSNPYEGERRAGMVGLPLPGVEAALFDSSNRLISQDKQAGEIRIKGDNVFLEYWENPQASQSSFHQGWFCTGDIAVRESGYYRIMGRSSVDIIKSGGYKLSALEIESVLLEHEDIKECAVIGSADDIWGEAVTAFVVLKSGTAITLEDLRSWCRTRMSAYKIPKKIRVLECLPRNALGKVTKPALKTLALSPS